MFSDPGDLTDPYARYTDEHFDEQVIPDLLRQHTGTVGEYSYSNLGYALLTRLLEKTTGRTWWDLAHELVLGPYGVTDVTVDPDPARVPALHTWTGKVRKQWTNTGPFIGAGGLTGTLDALEQYAHATAQDTAARGTPLGWQNSGGLSWHNDHNRDHGAFIGFTRTRLITVHTLGYRIGTADRTATRLLRQHQRQNSEQVRSFLQHRRNTRHRGSPGTPHAIHSRRNLPPQRERGRRFPRVGGHHQRDAATANNTLQIPRTARHSGLRIPRRAPPGRSRNGTRRLLGFPPAPFILAMRPDNMDDFESYAERHGPEIRVRINFGGFEGVGGDWYITPEADRAGFHLRFGLLVHSPPGSYLRRKRRFAVPPRPSVRSCRASACS